MRVISIANFKGGTGKTVTTVNTAAMLARMGRRVLVIDADPQHNTTDFFLGHPAEEENTLSDILFAGSPDWADAVTRTGREGIDLIPGDTGLLDLDVSALRAGSGDMANVLRSLCADIREDNAYDFVLIDCPPSFTAASIAAVIASDDIILPTTVDAFAISGLMELKSQIDALRRVQPGIRIAGVLVTMTQRSKVSEQGELMLRRSTLPVFKATIRRAVAVPESTFAREPLIDWAPRAGVTKDYQTFLVEYLKSVEGGKHG